MNRRFLIPPAAAVVLAACHSGGPVTSGNFDPLDAAGGGGSGASVANAGFKPGSFVKTSMDSAAFFRDKPDGNATADKLLPANTPMKVVATSGSYVKVELDSGEVGYIPSVMVIDQSACAAVPDYSGSPNEVQVWPPPSAYGAPPIVDPTNDPSVPVIPPVIDPDAPVEPPPPLQTLPDDAPTPGLGSEPPLPEGVTPAVPEVEAPHEVEAPKKVEP
jgi:hypothetical protein